MNLKSAAWTAIKATILSVFLIAMCALQSYAGYLHGLNSAPAPSVEYVPVPIPAPSPLPGAPGKTYESVTRLGITFDGGVVREPTSEAGMLYIVTLSANLDGGYSEPVIHLDFGERVLVLTMRVRSTDYCVHVKRIEGVEPKLPKEPPEEYDPDSDDF